MKWEYMLVAVVVVLAGCVREVKTKPIAFTAEKHLEYYDDCEGVRIGEVQSIEGGVKIQLKK
jgi:hypothetical protein